MRALVASVDADWTDHILHRCHQLRAYALPILANTSATGSGQRPGPKSVVEYAYARRTCNQALGLHAYVSDLKLLRRVLHERVARSRANAAPQGSSMKDSSTILAGQRKMSTTGAARNGTDTGTAARRPWPLLVWRSSTAQHYNTTGGVFDPAVLQVNKWPKMPQSVRCVPILAQQEELARQRNDLARHVLLEAHLEGTPGLNGDSQMASGPLFDLVLDTWQTDVALHSQHSRKSADCSHFCLHSDATAHWLKGLGGILCNARTPPSERHDDDNRHRPAGTAVPASAL